MRYLTPALALGALFVGAPAMANHLNNLETPYASRGACESAIAQFAAEDAPSLLERFPNFFSRRGDVSSFLTRAFSCDYDPVEQAWFITDRRLEILTSDWFLRKP
ncbi:hypothetical protein N0B51_12445 [Tsuneonella sp. YG55]|uniref:Uncharacterized protein n=1 Tax=Tsuneonella litorea TaxID=2976475 RepID=A0A9X3ANI9_9SPHN|nr:hypothetical protein [Tsuneonella litorea]MCT2559787.1 hypothetical protein [Tsuneonella litorea]